MQYISLKEHVYEYISSKINDGTLHRGDKLNEIQIGEELNVSRTPVREALIQLAADGYIENQPRRGFRVRGIDEKTAIEIYDIIGPLDGRAAYLSAGALSEEDISRMEFLVEAMDIAIEKSMFEEYYSMQMDFHEIYMHKCGNDQLLDLIGHIKKTFIRKRYAVCEGQSMQEVLQQTNREHHHMLELFKAKDGAALQDYVRDVHWCRENAKFDTL